ncbi:hypothetical protein [Saccharothrix syringae]|uniref:EF-hand domain-containing protein n=1 Tax=Saccharothrix syringae TaxID=103733 RepID=A0A5Q0H1M5_SACSY|nr:hypothetical protein [Saccharothrix syringae]QFZ20156.1 hypothetical protein EKG83_24550 [Saccharothrix syringae]
MVTAQGDLVARYARRLRLFDANADGIVRRRDVLAAAERLVHRFRLDPGAIGAERVRSAYEVLSLVLVADFGDPARDEVTGTGFATALAADPRRTAELGRRIAHADALAVRECLRGIGTQVKAEQVAEVVIALGAHPGDLPVIQQALEHDGTPLPLDATERLFTAYFTGSGDPRLYGRL